MIIVSTLCLFLSNHANKGLKYCLVTFALLLPCFIAAARDLSIGTDVMTYVKPMFDVSTSQSFIGMRSIISEQPLGYTLLVWVLTRLFGNISLVLGITEALIVFPIYYAIHKIARNFEWAGLLVYFLLFYSSSLNIMKQSIAMAFCLLAFVFSINRDFKKYLFFVFIAVLFHQTAFLMIIIYPISILLSYNYNEYSALVKYLIYVITAAGIVFVFVFGNYLISIIVGFKSSYNYMVDNSMTSINRSNIIFLLLLILSRFYIYLSNKYITNWYKRSDYGNFLFKNKKWIDINNLVWYFTFVGYCLIFLSLVTSGLNRVAYYFEYFIILLIPLLTKDKNIISRLIVCILIIFSVFIYIGSLKMGYNQVYPYTSSLLIIG